MQIPFFQCPLLVISDNLEVLSMELLENNFWRSSHGFAGAPLWGISNASKTRHSASESSSQTSI